MFYAALTSFSQTLAVVEDIEMRTNCGYTSSDLEVVENGPAFKVMLKKSYGEY